MDLSVIVPTFREVENLPHLADAITEALTPAGLRFEVIVVDDGSTDDSREVIAGYRTSSAAEA